MKTTVLVVLELLVGWGRSFADENPELHELERGELAARLEEDARSVLIHREGLAEVIKFMESRPDLFPEERPKGSRLMRREEKEVVWNTWQRFLDYQLALEASEHFYAAYREVQDDAREDSFLIGHAAMLARYRHALAFIEHAEMNPAMHTILNEPVPELGFPADTYSRLKFKFLNVAIGTQFAAREVILKTFDGGRRPEVREAIGEDAAKIWWAGRGRGEWMTLKNAVRIVQDGAGAAWLPVQTGVAQWMGDTKVYREGETLISASQLAELPERLVPGDILLERREWFLTNIGLPGFWPHAALYIGTPDERRRFFGEDPEFVKWVREQGEPSGDFEALLRSRYPETHAKSREPDEGGAPIRIIEGIAEGVSLTTLETSAACDSLAVLRPKLSKIEKARAVLRAFHYVGRPYDFGFDFATDSRLVCTELVYKSYEPSEEWEALDLPVIEILGRNVMPANLLAKQFDEHFGTAEQQFDLVVFLDGQELAKRAVESTVAEFRDSWRRPKWHVFVLELE